MKKELKLIERFLKTYNYNYQDLETGKCYWSHIWKKEYKDLRAVLLSDKNSEFYEDYRNNDQKTGYIFGSSFFASFNDFKDAFISELKHHAEFSWNKAFKEECALTLKKLA